ncbi:carbohydrate kinase family protein [Salinisphaera sp. USBA-960]|nr:carbohydrate kinase family protein [Salifodinibacter halophilus]NNC26444.1 carbohydrate kinase family protein [Salifodinibacter halophilus]
MSALICGSIAFDTLMSFEGRFADEILPDHVHRLNVSFLVPNLDRQFGGCAGNIAYSLNLLGGEGYAMGAVGKDFRPYQDWLDQHGISRKYVKEIEDTYCAQAYITSDADGNQFTAFHPGAMNRAHEQHVPTDDSIDLGVIAPDGKDGMVQHAKQFADAGIDFIFDPGQGLPMFDGDELKTAIDQAAYVSVNEYEAQVIGEKTGLSVAEIAARVKAFIITSGADGATIHVGGRTINVPAATPASVNDPTGCGDAFRAGLIVGLQEGYDWEITGRMATLMGTIKVEHDGTQNHALTRDEFRARFEREFERKVA